MYLINFGCELFLLLTFTFISEANYQRSAFFSVNPKSHAGPPYRIIPIPHGKNSPIYGAAECVNDKMCLSYDIGYSEVHLYTGYMCIYGTHCKNTRCPPVEEMLYSSVLDMCYRLSDHKADWTTANDTCYQQGGRLIVLDTDRKFAQFIAEYNDVTTESYWLGGHKFPSGYQWNNGQEIPLSSSYWHPGQPEGGYPCLQSGRMYFQSTGLDDLPCGNLRYFMCEY